VIVALVAATYATILLAIAKGYQPSADSHYHFMMGRAISRGEIFPDVARALPLTILHDMPVDHYWGYHVLLAPFALVPNAEVGMKIATVFFFALVFFAIDAFLRARGIRFSWAWSLACAAFSTQDWRYLQLRGGQWMVPLLFAMTHVAFFEERVRRRRVLLVAIAYVAMLSYHGAIVLLPFHVGGVLALALFRRGDLHGRFIEPVFVALGLALGLTINPYMDARASTWRFFALHVGDMGRDTAHLYDDLDVAEFHGFPLRVAIANPEWLVLLVAAIAAIAWIAWRARDETKVDRASVVLAGMCAVGIALTLRAMRTREYAVPIAMCLFAVLAPRRAARTAMREWAIHVLVGAVTAVTLFVHGMDTIPLIRTHLPTHQYDGARALLEKNGDHPILNIAEADYCMLLWQWDRVVCVQALSRYFIYPYKDLFHDVWTLHDHADTSPDTKIILKRFWDRGVRLVAVHRTNVMWKYAERHPDELKPVFRSPINGATIYALDREHLE
jgi:hypothetical protein